eukprot:gene8658-7889_t
MPDSLHLLARAITMRTTSFANGTASGGCEQQSGIPDLLAFVAEVPCDLQIFVSRQPGGDDFRAPLPETVGGLQVGEVASGQLQSNSADRIDVVLVRTSRDPFRFSRPDSVLAGTLVPVSAVDRVNAYPALLGGSTTTRPDPIPLEDLAASPPTVPVQGMLSTLSQTTPLCATYVVGEQSWNTSSVVSSGLGCLPSHLSAFAQVVPADGTPIPAYTKAPEKLSEFSPGGTDSALVMWAALGYDVCSGEVPSSGSACAWRGLSAWGPPPPTVHSSAHRAVGV